MSDPAPKLPPRPELGFRFGYAFMVGCFLLGGFFLVFGLIFLFIGSFGAVSESYLGGLSTLLGVLLFAAGFGLSMKTRWGLYATYLVLLTQLSLGLFHLVFSRLFASASDVLSLAQLSAAVVHATASVLCFQYFHRRQSFFK